MTRFRVLAIAIGLVGITAGCGSSGSTTGGTGSGGSAGPGGSDGGVTTSSGGTTGSGGAMDTGGAMGTGGAGGAGGTGTVTHCDINNGAQECIEYSPRFPSAQQGCAVLTGTYSSGQCDLTGSSGGCKQMFGSDTQTTYYYTPTVTSDAVMVQCANDGNATYVAP